MSQRRCACFPTFRSASAVCARRCHLCRGEKVRGPRAGPLRIRSRTAQARSKKTQLRDPRLPKRKSCGNERTRRLKPSTTLSTTSAAPTSRTQGTHPNFNLQRKRRQSPVGLLGEAAGAAAHAPKAHVRSRAAVASEAQRTTAARSARIRQGGPQLCARGGATSAAADLAQVFATLTDACKVARASLNDADGERPPRTRLVECIMVMRKALLDKRGGVEVAVLDAPWQFALLPGGQRRHAT